MSFYNNSYFSPMPKVLTVSPFIEEYSEGTLIPPPGSDFMVTEIIHEFMKSETSTDLMITES